VPTLEDEVSFITAHTSAANSILLMAEVDGEIAGLIGLEGEPLPEEAHVGTFGVSVDQAWRGRGIGGALIDALVTWAGDNGVTRVQGYVWATNPRALELYQRHGFVLEGLSRRAIMRDGESIDVYLIARLLDD
jgi:putative acetyltransferase